MTNKKGDFFRSVLTQCQKGIIFLKDRLPGQQFLILLCIVVSIVAGISAVLLKLFVFHIGQYVFNQDVSELYWYPSLAALVGIGLSSLLILKVFKKKFLKGNDTIVYAIAKQQSVLPFSEMYSPLITSGITVGLGGSAGLESPIVAAGSAIGSNFGKAALLPSRDKTLLIACGTAAGIASAFSAPIAGVLFAIEVLMVDISSTSLVPLLLAGAIGSLMAQMILGNEILLSFPHVQAFDYANIPYYIVLGILSGLVALYYARTFGWVEKYFNKIGKNWLRWLVGSLSLGILIFLFPPLFGEGYLFIKGIANTGMLPRENQSFLLNNVSNPWVFLLFTVALVFLKVFATAFTLLGGGNGGSFAPSLFIGATVGYVLGQFCLLCGLSIPLANFIVVGMAGMLSGIFYAPLTAIFLSAELTNGYALFIPLMIVSAISYLLTRYFEPLSMEMKKLKLKTAVDPRSKDRFLLSRLDLSSFILKDFGSFEDTDTLEQASKKILLTDHHIFAVVDHNRHYEGVVIFNDLKGFLLDPANVGNQEPVTNIMLHIKPLNDKESIRHALSRFDKEEVFHNQLPVVDDDNKWLGFVSKGDILSNYRSEIINSSF